MTIRRLVQTIFLVLTIVALVTAVFIWVAVRQRAELVRVQQQRLSSFKLADELRQSSDDLTKLARLFVSTGEPRFEQYYRDVLAIRQGTKPRPMQYNRIYWDFLIAGGTPPRADSAAVPLQQLMQEAGFTEAELALLRSAESRSNALTAIEERAMRAVKGEFLDAAGGYTKRGRPDRELAIRLMNDSGYHRAKAEIMKPIDDFLGAVDERTSRKWDEFRRTTAAWFVTIESLAALFLLIVLAAYPVLQNRVLNPVRTLQRRTADVASDLDRLAGVTRRIAAGDFKQSYAVTAAPTQSGRQDEMGDLARMQDRMIGQLQDTGASVASITSELGRAHAVSKRRFEAIFQESPLALTVSVAETGEFVEVNRAALALIGAKGNAEVIGRTSTELQLYTVAEREQKVAGPLRKSGRLQGEKISIRRLDAKEVQVELWATFYEAEGVQYVLSSIVDISDRLTLEEQLRQSQKMDAMGRLAGGIAHDFNNLLTVIIGFGSLILADKQLNPKVVSDVGEMVKAADRAAEMTRQLLAFSRKQVVEPRDVDLNAVLGGVEKMMRRMIGDDVKLKTVKSPDLGVIRADPGQLEQIVANLSVNARDAMPTGGTITMTTENVVVDEEFAAAHQSARAGSFVRLSVSDTGTGMTPEVMTRIFEPFFTTKEIGKGTGLGLSTVFGIVQQSEGFTLVRSRVGQGTTFDIYFPRIENRAADMADTMADKPAEGGKETVLVAEDNVALRELTTRVLSERGYNVLSAPSGDEAMAMAERLTGSLDLLVTDVIMPGMSGRALAEGLQRSRPSLRVLYVSGYPDEMLGRYGALDEGITLLPKPFTPESLSAKVREILDRPA